MIFTWNLSSFKLPAYTLILSVQQKNNRLTALLPTQRNFGEKNASDSGGIMPTRSTFEEINLKRPASAIWQVRVNQYCARAVPRGQKSKETPKLGLSPRGLKVFGFKVLIQGGKDLEKKEK